MLVVVAYDVQTSSKEGARRLRQVAKICVNRGQRVQNSVFECLVDELNYKILKYDLMQVIDMQKDTIRFYKLGNHYKNRIESYGKDNTYDPEGLLLA